MDKIIIKGLKLFAYHGVHKKEKIEGQNFIFNTIIYLSLKKPGITDNLNDTVSYSEIIKVTKRVALENKYNLIEKLAYEIIKKLFLNFNLIESIDLCLKKPQAPIEEDFEYVAVEIFKKREDFF